MILLRLDSYSWTRLYLHYVLCDYSELTFARDSMQSGYPDYEPSNKTPLLSLCDLDFWHELLTYYYY